MIAHSRCRVIGLWAQGARTLAQEAAVLFCGAWFGGFRTTCFGAKNHTGFRVWGSGVSVQFRFKHFIDTAAGLRCNYPCYTCCEGTPSRVLELVEA